MLWSDLHPRRLIKSNDITKTTYFHFLFEAKNISVTNRTLGSDEMSTQIITYTTHVAIKFAQPSTRSIRLVLGASH